MDYYMRLTTIHSQFRAVGVNYNQITKALKATYTEKKALAFLYKLEQATRDLVSLQHKIIALKQDFHFIDGSGVHDIGTVLCCGQAKKNHQPIQGQRPQIQICQNAGTNQRRKPLPLGTAISMQRQYQNCPQTS